MQEFTFHQQVVITTTQHWNKLSVQSQHCNRSPVHDYSTANCSQPIYLSTEGLHGSMTLALQLVSEICNMYPLCTAVWPQVATMQQVTNMAPALQQVSSTHGNSSPAWSPHAPIDHQISQSIATGRWRDLDMLWHIASLTSALQQVASVTSTCYNKSSAWPQHCNRSPAWPRHAKTSHQLEHSAATNCQRDLNI